ncbi:SpaA isopeptide-forming pilin-related protein [Enterococcus faecalis]|uniref:SpaA isopeptide-forming pilin-related protein n=1 Tax=Enterococcus faecalis TaxID=1351 RepID=UPI0030F43DE0
MKWKKGLSIVGTLVMLLGQNIAGVAAFAETVTNNNSVETQDIYFENNETKLAKLDVTQGEDTAVTLVDTNKEDQEVTVSLPSSVTLNQAVTNTQLGDASSANYDQNANEVKVIFKNKEQDTKKVNLVLTGKDANKGTTTPMFAKAIRLDGQTYRSVVLPVSVIPTETNNKQANSEASTTENDGEPEQKMPTQNDVSSVRSGNMNVDLDISPVSDSVLSGEDLVYALNFKVTGSQTTYHNAKISVTLPTGYSLNQDLNNIQIAGVTPTFDATTGVLSYVFQELTAGQTGTVNLKVGTINGTTSNGSEVKLTADFSADEFSGNAKTEATEAINASSSLSTSKTYLKTLDSNGDEKDTPPLAGDTGIWNIKVSAAKKTTGLLYFKERSKITVVDTLPDGMTYVSDNANGTYNNNEKTITWEFDAPNLAEQQVAIDTLFEKEINVTVKFNNDIDNFQKFTNKVHAEGIDLDGNTVQSDASANVSAGKSDPNVIPPGNLFWPNHGGPVDGKANDGGAFNSNNPDPVVYDTALLKFSVSAVPGTASSPTKDFKKYDITYDVDSNLEVYSLPFAGAMRYQPDTSYPDNVDMKKVPIATIYLTVNGQERKALDHVEIRSKNFSRSDLGLKDGEHVSQIRIVNDYMPAGLISGYFYPIFTIKKDFTGTVTNKVKYDVVGYNANGDEVSWNRDSDYDDINSLTGPRTAEVVPTPADTLPIVRTSVRFDNSNGGIIKEGENRVTGNFYTDKSSSVSLNKPLESVVLLPVGVKVKTDDPEYSVKNTANWDNKTQDGNNTNGTIKIITDNYNNSNQQLVKIQWNEEKLIPGKDLGYGFNIEVSKGAPTPLRVDTYGFSGDEKFTVPSGASTLTDSYLQVDSDDLNSNGNNTQNRVLSSNQYRMLKENQIKTEKLVKGEKDTDYSKFGYTTLGGRIDYQLNMENTGNDIGNFVMMDVLPSENDLGITDNTERGSKFTPVLTGPITIPNEWQDKVTIEYSEAMNPSRQDLDKDVNYPSTTDHLVDPAGAQAPNWKAEKEVTDWSKIHSYIVHLNDGQWTKGDKITLTFSMKAPEKLSSDLTNPKIDEKTRAAWNSFAYSANNSQVVEPERVGVVVDYVGSVILTKTDGKTGEELKGAEFELQDKDGKKLQEGLVTDDKGQIKVDNLAPGDYQFVETKAPADYQLDATPVTFTIKNDQTEAVQVKMDNTLTPGSVVLTKVDDKTGEALKGTEFELQDKDGKKLQEGLVTDNKGQIKVDNLAPGDYQFVETKAPKDYQLDQTPVPFTIERGQTEAVQVKMTNKRVIPPVDPDIHKDVEDEQHIDLTNRNQKFDWHVYTTFGSDTSNWKQASVVDPVNSLLEILNVTITDENGKDVSKNGELKIEGNKITFTLNKKDGSYGYLANHVYKMTITTKIRDDVTDDQLAPYINNGKGIPNQADLNFGDGDTKYSEIPTVTPPKNTVPDNSHSSDMVVPSKGVFPHTGENTTMSNLLLLAGLIIIGGLAVLVVIVNKKKES